MESRLKKQYKEQVVPALKEQFGYKNIMQVPELKKVVLNVGYGRHLKDAGFIENVEKTLRSITGQSPVHNKAKKSISNFKIREGMKIGISVTLRGQKMYDFIDKLTSVTLPRVRDFRGISSKSFDKTGNFTLGFKEHIAFPEIKGDSIEKIHGLEVVINTSANTKEEGQALLEKLGFPFKK
ncbi:MAG: 50S ribosomal protein L5 [Candidatus Magasanikbacteria bacterium]|jgi:large subunit ribosomal protein L5|nr:50S ribosomal protein L5 [Candidatus Magasanikbacteria bacterium]MBT4314653.1 50S ribosomal protein L5 [Candidatus Magasanikbacteria bacterium]MBT4547073.1 50S ribosomal protein L5 [Candidatus Magasanikbacteria bacterium]MBT6819533.1 50S ribosomal protein L5 [Candidatus Magasanikbacteria bacterium]